MKGFKKFIESIDEKAGFESSIDSNPTESTIHLVYADWLQERAETEEDNIEIAFRRSIGEWMQTPYGSKCNDPSQVPDDPERRAAITSINAQLAARFPDFGISHPFPEPFPWVVQKPTGNTNNTLPQGVYSSEIKTTKNTPPPDSPYTYLIRGFYSWREYRNMETTFRKAFNFNKMRSWRKK